MNYRTDLETARLQMGQAPNRFGRHHYRRETPRQIINRASNADKNGMITKGSPSFFPILKIPKLNLSMIVPEPTLPFRISRSGETCGPTGTRCRSVLGLAALIN